MKIYVISLRHSERRRASMQRQLCDAGMDFAFFDAISGHDALNHVHHYDDSEFIRNCGRSATANEIGCYASHLALWQRCAKGSEPFLILEDDARLDPGFVHGFGVIGRRIRRMNLIRASGPFPKHSYSLEKSGPFDFRLCRRVPLLTLGYALAPSAARKLSVTAGIVSEPIDKYMQRFWLHDQQVVALHPPILHASSLFFESDVGDRLCAPDTPGIWMQRALRKSSNSIKREVFNLRISLRRRILERLRIVPTSLAESDIQSL